MKRLFLSIFLIFTLLSCQKTYLEKMKGKKQERKIVSIISSKNQTANSHPLHLFDQDSKSIWVASNDKSGVGESIEITLDHDIILNRLGITPSPNSKKIKRLLIVCNSDKASYDKTIHFNRSEKEQIIPFIKTFKAKRITIYIQDIYKDKSLPNETGLSGISLYHNSEQVIFTNVAEILKQKK